MSRSEFAEAPLPARVFLVALLLVSGGLFAWAMLNRFGYLESASKDTAFAFLAAAIFAQALGPFFARRALRFAAAAVALGLLVAFFVTR